MPPYSALALLSAILAVVLTFMLPICGHLLALLSSLYDDFLYSTSAFLGSVLGAFARLFGVSVALLALCWASKLSVPTNVPRAQLSPLGMLLGLSGGSLMARTLCVLDPFLHLGVLVLGLLYLLHKFFLVGAPPLASSAVHAVTYVDAAIQVQSIPAPPVTMRVPVYPYVPVPMGNPLLVHPAPAGCPLLPFPT